MAMSVYLRQTKDLHSLCDPLVELTALTLANTFERRSQALSAQQRSWCEG